MKKIIINKDLCIGCGACAACCPDNFEIGDDFIAKTISNEITEDVNDAIQNCPTEAIEIVNEESTEN